MDDEKFERARAFIIGQRAKFEINNAKAPKRFDRTNALIRKIDQQIYKTNKKISSLKNALLTLASSARSNRQAIKALKRRGKQTDARLRKIAKRVKAPNESHNRRKN